jgi:hypothetical protein
MLLHTIKARAQLTKVGRAVVGTKVGEMEGCADGFVDGDFEGACEGKLVWV